MRSRLADQLPAPVLYDALTVVSELVANAWKHGPGEKIGVEIKLESDGTIRGAVEDSGTTPFGLPPDDSPHPGLGLRIVDAIATSWDVREGGGRVSFAIPQVG